MFVIKYLLFLCFIIAFLPACKHRDIVKHNGEKDLISFKAVKGIGYTEIARRKADGLSFNAQGYYLEPQWRINFISDDSTSIYSPSREKFINFPLTRGYDSIFNTARTWLKVKQMNKDSIKLEVLESYGDSVDTRGSKIYMILYADNYIKNVLHSDTGILKRASRNDTLYIKQLTNIANEDYRKAFAGLQPAELKSKSHFVRIKKWKTEGDLLNHFNTSDDYMSPTFDIAINKADSNFYYSFSIFVDINGGIHYGKPLIAFFDESFRENYIQFSKAIMENYLKYYLDVKPGSTLGIVHASEINVHVDGKTGR
ncbi:hypothetical protein [Mucilaginibacter aquaedulcis]|uniref:hypothetical protein n=1 Tax=Mucilaginibacter aquaedulcis TaxID=1187081 RepID=UPI0025B510FB|nr:hypothetical protein [Mucilaginibacter aquaedulcis]MDN3548048.1 hypothetical protein [Mucilaginibacter aquaedulcis]